MRESEIQRAIVSYCRAVLPPISLVFAVPNASRRTRTGKASNAVPGLLKGVSDLVVMPKPGVVIFAEVKGPRGKTSLEQEAFANSVRVLGAHFAVWRSIDDARNTFMALQIRTRESLQWTSQAPLTISKSMERQQ